MLRVHLVQNWFGYSDPAMEESLYETMILRQFAGLRLDRIPEEATTLNFRRLLENSELADRILQAINLLTFPRYAACESGMKVEDLAFELMSDQERGEGVE